METAPRDGSVIIGLYDGVETRVRWAEERRCMLSVVASGAGTFGPGWEDVTDLLVVDDPSRWRQPAKQDLVWVRRNEDKPHRCPRCHAVATWDREEWGPRTRVVCERCGVQWRMGCRLHRWPMRSGGRRGWRRL